MTSAGIRCSAVVLIAALATAGCKEGSNSGSPSADATAQQTSRQETGNSTGTPEAAKTLASVFPGSGDEHGSGPTIQMPQTRVNKPATGNVAINVPGGQQPKPEQDLVYRAEGNGEGDVKATDCLGPQPPNPCSVTIEHTPTQPGPYSGELVVTTADGATTTYPVVGFALGDTTSTTQPPTSDTPTSEIPTTTPPTTPPTTPVNTATPSPPAEDGAGTSGL